MPSPQQNKYPIIMCLWHKKLDAQAICPYNHNLNYENGWFQFDDDVGYRDTDLVEEAQEFVDLGYTGYFEYCGMRDIPRMVAPDGDEYE